MIADARDSALVALARAGDENAFGELLERHRPRALRLVSRLLGEAAEAEDVLQEACLQAFLRLEHLRHPDRFGAWLCGIALNLGRMRLRARRAEFTWDDLDGGRVATGFGWPELEPSPEAITEAREVHALILWALEALPVEQQAVVRLHYLDGLTLEEIGVLAGSPLGTVKARLHRAREKLRAQLAHHVTASRAQTGKEVVMIETDVQDVVARMRKGADKPEESFRYVVLLKERGGERVLPIWIGYHEGGAIALQLAGQSAPRPLTYELTARLLEVAGATVERVAVSGLQAEVFYATLWVRAHGQLHQVDARPSDALNLALRLKVPILVAEEVMAEAGIAAGEEFEKLEASFWKGREVERIPLQEAGVEWRSMPPPDLSWPKRTK